MWHLAEDAARRHAGDTLEVIMMSDGVGLTEVNNPKVFLEGRQLMLSSCLDQIL